MNYKIETDEEFDRDVKILKKKFKLIKQDILELVDILKINPFSGIDLGSGLFKIRLKNSSIPTGKSGGFRVIYYVIIDEKIILLKMYSKTEKENISDVEFNNLKERIKKWFL